MGLSSQRGPGSQGFLSWQKLVNHRKVKSTLCSVEGEGKLLKEKLGISDKNPGFERAVRS